MYTIGQLVFYVPFSIMSILLLYYMKWTKRKFTVLIAILPTAYFAYQIFSFRHWETESVLVTNIIGLVISQIFLIIWILILRKHPK
ncbi:glucose uptake protein [Enterococcus hirae]|nr:glucose uptake protein [Enterococcus hirae]